MPFPCLDLFHEAIDVDNDFSGKPEKPEQAETEQESTLTLTVLLVEEADYDGIVLPGCEFELQAKTGQTGNTISFDGTAV